jgi:polyhydroxyalkanoate synthesis repressor PhaR
MAEQDGPEQDREKDGTESVVIRKYANRRLYNTATGSFVTLEGLHRMVVDGERFVVVDARSGNDITASVLTQIIAEQESRGESLLPLDLLRQVISLYDKGLGGQLSHYLNQSMDGFVRNMEQMQRLGDMGRRNLELFQRSFGMFAPGAGRSGERREATGRDGAKPPPDPPPDLSGEVRSLREQLAAVQRKLDALSDGDDKS